jgi:hypothetical protein
MSELHKIFEERDTRLRSGSIHRKLSNLIDPATIHTHGEAYPLNSQEYDSDNSQSNSDSGESLEEGEVLLPMLPSTRRLHSADCPVVVNFQNQLVRDRKKVKHHAKTNARKTQSHTNPRVDGEPTVALYTKAR